MNIAYQGNYFYHAGRSSGVPFAGLLGPSLSREGVSQAPGKTGPGRFARTISRVRHSFSVRRTIAELSRLDDRTLRDIGLRRADIGTAAAAAVMKGFATGHVLEA